MKITFLHTEINEFPPVLSKDELPEWYKSMPSYMDGIKAHSLINGLPVTTATIKKCMPVFDILSSGYLIKTWADIEIYFVDDVPYFKIEEPILKDHNVKQADKHPQIQSKDDMVAKFINKWGIKTNQGTSCLFIPPSHRNNVLSILPGIVDTDTYHLPVHLPLVISDRTFSGVIPKGTPIAQVIPFTRQEWDVEYAEITKEEQKEILVKLYSQPYNGYKDKFWSKTQISKE